MNKNNWARFIDHTLLKPESSAEDLRRLCSEAKQFGFFSVCVNSFWVAFCKKELFGSQVKVCTVVGFPLGASIAEANGHETRLAVQNGADEIDMVLNIGAAKSGWWDEVTRDIKGVVVAAAGRPVKVILETHLLTEAEKVRACQAAAEAGAQFVKTSTGFTGGGATITDVKLMKKSIPSVMEVKASGGVRDLAQFQDMINAGATRIGTSSGVKILQNEATSLGSY